MSSITSVASTSSNEPTVVYITLNTDKENVSFTFRLDFTHIPTNIELEMLAQQASNNIANKYKNTL